MLFRSLLSRLLLLICLGFCGCYQGGEGQADEQKNPYFLAGRERVAGRDYKGAIEAFEKALEANPHSVQAHFELAMLYDNHSDQKEEDYVAAMYHYNQVIKLHPNDYPADNARQRIAFCKRELVKTEALAPVAQNLIRDMGKLKEENQSLRNQLESLRPPSGGRTSSPTPSPMPLRPSDKPKDTVPQTFFPPRPNAPTGSVAGGVAPVFSRDRVTPLPSAPSPARTHTVRERDTFFSIARQYHLKPEALVAANPTLDPKRLKVGQVINIPSI